MAGKASAAAAAKAVAVAKEATANSYKYPWKEKLAKYKDNLAEGFGSTENWALGSPWDSALAREIVCRRGFFSTESSYLDWPYDPPMKEMINKRKGTNPIVWLQMRANAAELMKKMLDLL